MLSFKISPILLKAFSPKFNLFLILTLFKVFNKYLLLRFNSE